MVLQAGHGGLGPGRHQLFLAGLWWCWEQGHGVGGVRGVHSPSKHRCYPPQVQSRARPGENSPVQCSSPQLQPTSPQLKSLGGGGGGEHAAPSCSHQAWPVLALGAGGGGTGSGSCGGGCGGAIARPPPHPWPWSQRRRRLAGESSPIVQLAPPCWQIWGHAPPCPPGLCVPLPVPLDKLLAAPFPALQWLCRACPAPFYTSELLRLPVLPCFCGGGHVSPPPPDMCVVEAAVAAG